MLPSVASAPEPQQVRESADASRVSNTTSDSAAPVAEKPAATIQVANTEVPVNFVDLYEVLQVPPETQASIIRKRIMELYLEAQKNLDHRNNKKRLFFNQMFEVHLPQARYLLLDPKRRATYDGHLHIFREDVEKETVIRKALEKATRRLPKTFKSKSLSQRLSRKIFRPKNWRSVAPGCGNCGSKAWSTPTTLWRN
jgi:hypothetical protein